ncbi:hypothetical protein ABZ590_03975 [Streptomyces hirsutus]|uniref:hypothetical protein n=1 Tax=Streptomyces hirsutus TaxID=35620 RepID=UPI0033EA8A06
MDKPRSGLAWLEMRRGQPGNASQLLRRLGLGEIPLTHDAFHELQPWRAAAHLEELLMTCGVLPVVDKYLCSFQRRLPGHLTGITDPEHVKTIRLFATWHVLPRLRARAERSHITPSVRRFAAEQIKYATAFLQWLGERNSTLASCGQIDVDAWYADSADRSRSWRAEFAQRIAVFSSSPDTSARWGGSGPWTSASSSRRSRGAVPA